jgi:hypothetical protein
MKRRNSRRPANFGKQRDLGGTTPTTNPAAPQPKRQQPSDAYVSSQEKGAREQQPIDIVSVETSTSSNLQTNQALTPQQSQRQNKATNNIDHGFIDALPTPSISTCTGTPRTPSEKDIQLMEQQVEAMKRQLEEAHKSHRIQMKKHTDDMQELKNICEELVIDRGRSRCSFFCA